MRYSENEQGQLDEEGTINFWITESDAYYTHNGSGGYGDSFNGNWGDGVGQTYFTTDPAKHLSMFIFIRKKVTNNVRQ